MSGLQIKLSPIAWVVLGVLTITAPRAAALESDEFTLPPKPLADTGAELDAHVSKLIDESVEAINEQISDIRAKREKATDYYKKYFDKEIAQLHGERPVLHELRKRTGTGIPSPTIEVWMNRHNFEAQPARHKFSYGDTIFGSAAFFKPLLLIAMAPTVKVHGIHCGTDKIGHLFQQGWEYYGVYEKKIARGKSQKVAMKAAADNGLGRERSVYGKWWTGIVSNSDLASNYAGLKFYLNLVHEVKIGKRKLPPILIVKDGVWQRNPEAKHVLKPFITEHFSEAFNPSRYDVTARGSVRKALLSRGEAWVKFHDTTREKEVKRLKRVTTFFGEYYGHQGKQDELVTIVNAYFDVVDPPDDAGDKLAQSSDGKAEPKSTVSYDDDENDFW